MTMGAKRTPCSDQSLARADPMFGTASAGSTWLMLELEGPWGPSAFLQSPTVIDPTLGRAIVRRAEAAKMRIAAIRRHGRRSGDPRWRWYVAQSDPGGEALYHGVVDDPRDYLEVALDGSDGERVDGPLVAVCAHGKHDQCCAVRGRAAVAAIAAEYPESTWECSHLGGDRFAATMLVLPVGLCYGRVDSADAVDLIRRYHDGRLNDEFLRGRTSLPHAVQAAQHFAREKWGDDRIDAWAPADVATRDGSTRVTLRDGARTAVVTVAERMSAPLLSQCAATTEGRVRTFVLESLSRSG